MDSVTSFAKAIGELANMALQVLELVINAIKTALENYPDTFNAVGMCHAAHKLLSTAVD